MTSKRKLTNIKCRECQIEILRQNYHVHLERAHPDVDANDLREYGQHSLFDTAKKCKPDHDKATPVSWSWLPLHKSSSTN